MKLIIDYINNLKIKCININDLEIQIYTLGNTNFIDLNKQDTNQLYFSNKVNVVKLLEFLKTAFLFDLDTYMIIDNFKIIDLYTRNGNIINRIIDDREDINE